MHKTIPCVLMMALLLTGCAGGGGEDTAADLAADIRAEYQQLDGWSATVELTAEYGEKLFDFTVDAQWQREGETVLTVTAPAAIAGITARVAQGEAVLEYDGAAVSLGLLDPDGLTPMSAVPQLMDAVRAGYLAESGWTGEGEGRQLWVLCRDPDLAPQEGTEFTLFFDPDSHALAAARVTVAGADALTATFNDFTMEMNQDGTGDHADLG